MGSAGAKVVDDRLLRRSRAIGWVLACMGLVLSSLVFAGWLGHFLPLVWFLAPEPMGAMGAAASLLGIVIGGGLLARHRRWIRVSRIAGWLVSAYALTKVIQWTTGLPPLLDPSVNQLLGWPPLTSGQLAPLTSFGMCFLGLGLALFGRSGREALVQVLAWGALAVAYTGLIGHLLGLPRLLGPASGILMALPTAVLLALLAVSLLFLSMEAGFMALFVRQGPGAELARRLLPLALALPTILVAIGFQILGKEDLNLQGILLWMIVSSACVMGVATLVAARALQRLDEERLVQTRALAQSEARFRHILEGSRDPILLLGEDRSLKYANAATLKLLGFPARTLDVIRLQASLQAESLPVWIGLWKGFKAEGRFHEEPLELVWVREDGSHVRTRCHISNVRNAEGAVTGMVLVVQPQRRGDDDG